MSKDLAKKESVQLDIFHDMEFSTGLEMMDASDFNEKIPFLTLVQNTSSALGKHKELRPGQFFLKSDESDDGVITMDTIEASVVIASKQRTLWPEKYASDSKPLCRSYDGKTMAQGGEGEGVCARCKYSKWEKDKGSRCRESFSIVVSLIKDGEPEYYRIGVKGTSLAPLKTYLKETQNMYRKYVSQGVMAKIPSGFAPIYFFQTKIGSEFVSNAKGNYFVMTFSTPEPNSKIFLPDGDVDREILSNYNEANRLFIETAARYNESSSMEAIPAQTFTDDEDDLPF